MSGQDFWESYVSSIEARDGGPANEGPYQRPSPESVKLPGQALGVCSSGGLGCCLVPNVGWRSFLIFTVGFEVMSQARRL